MKIFNWLMGQIYNREESYMGGSSGEFASKAIEFQVEKEEKEFKQNSDLSLPDQLIVRIFGYFVADALNKPFDSQALLPLLRCARVCRQWHRIAEDSLSKIFVNVWRNQEKPESNMTWAQSLGLLYNWKHQVEKVSFLATSQLVWEEFKPVNCHSPLENPAITLDKVEVNAIRVLLSTRYLMGVSVKTVNGCQISSRLWQQAVQNPEGRLIVSTDQKLFATRHYDLAKNKKDVYRLVCRFDVRHLATGQLLGNIHVVCPNDQKVFDDKNVQFDFTKFMYQKEGKLRTRYYDPCLIEDKRAKLV